MMSLNEKRQLIEALRKGVVTVTFSKVSPENAGEIRVMPCTLSQEVLKANGITNKLEVSQTERTHEGSDHLGVWATDVKNWRSFRFESIIGWEVLGE